MRAEMDREKNGVSQKAIALFFRHPSNFVSTMLVGNNIALVIYGIYSLIFFCTMAIHMVGGKRIFYRSILLLDLGVFMLCAFKGSERLILLYLLLLLAAMGALDLVRALEFRKAGAPWKFRAIVGAACIVIAITGFIYRSDPNTLVYIFCLGLFCASISKIVSVFRKTAVIYIPE